MVNLVHYPEQVDYLRYPRGFCYVSGFGWCERVIHPLSTANTYGSVDLDWMTQGGIFHGPLKWKSVAHMKSTGSVSDIRLPDGFTAQDSTTPGQVTQAVACIQGFVAFGKTLYVPCDVPCWLHRYTPKGATGRAGVHQIVGALAHYDVATDTLHTRSIDVVLSDLQWNDSTVRWDRLSWSATTSNSGLSSQELFAPDLLAGVGRNGWVRGDTSPWVAHIKSLFFSGDVDYNLDKRPGALYYQPPRSSVRVPDASRRPLDARLLARYVDHDRIGLASATERALRHVRPKMDATAFDELERFDGNLALWLSKAPSMGSVTLNSVIELVKDGVSRQQLASYWLANRYGDRLSISGLRDIVESLNRYLAYDPARTPAYGRICRSRGSEPLVGFEGTCACSVTVHVMPRNLGKLGSLVRSLYEWDAYPTLGNVWDAIPLSFILDWFLNVGEIYASVDRLVQSRYYDVLCVMEAARAEVRGYLVPEVTHTYYLRRDGGPLQLGVSEIALGLPSAINCISGAALLCGL